jgi:hypothetical protein
MVRLHSPSNPTSGPSLAPCSFTEVPTATDWCGLNWSASVDLRSASRSVGARLAGVYKLMDGQDVVYIGESESVAERLWSHATQKGNGLVCSVVLMSAAPAYQRRERETDLIGAYYKRTGSPPRLQYRRSVTPPLTA